MESNSLCIKLYSQREMRALYKLNKCSNIVNILGDDYLVISTTKEKVGVIYLEYINGIELGKSSIENFSAKERFSIIKQLLDAIEISHSNGIIHRDINLIISCLPTINRSS